MRHVKSTVIAAVLAETILCIGYAVFGSVSFTRSENTNVLGLATLFFHLPGLFLSKLFFGDKIFFGTDFFGTTGTWKEWVVTIFTGAVQFFLLAWAALEIRSRMRKPTNGD